MHLSNVSFLVFENVNRKQPTRFSLKNWSDKLCFISRFFGSMDRKPVVNGAEHCSSTEMEQEKSLLLNYFPYAFRVWLPRFLEQLHFSVELNTLHSVIRNSVPFRILEFCSYEIS